MRKEILTQVKITADKELTAEMVSSLAKDGEFVSLERMVPLPEGYEEMGLEEQMKWKTEHWGTPFDCYCSMTSPKGFIIATKDACPVEAIIAFSAKYPEATVSYDSTVVPHMNC